MMKNITARIAAFALAALTLAAAAGCQSNSDKTSGGGVTGAAGVKLESTELTGKTLLASSSRSASIIPAPSALQSMKTSFTARDRDVGYEQTTATMITLSGNSAKISGKGAISAEGNVTITDKGTYVISGNLDNGTLFVDAGESAKVQLVFDGVNISSSNFAAVFIKNADKVFITLSEGKTNNLADGSKYVLTQANSYINGEQKNVDAVIFSRADLTINGTGTLNVVGSYKHAIVSKDDLVITDGTLNVSAPNVGLYGSDSVRIGGGMINIEAGTDAIRAENQKTDNRGYVYIENGNVTASASSDGIQASSAIFIAGGTTLISAKKAPIKSGMAAVITGGTFAALGNKFDCPVSDSSTQAHVLFTEKFASGENDTLTIAQSGASSSLASFKSSRNALVMIFTTPELVKDTEYAVYKD